MRVPIPDTIRKYVTNTGEPTEPRSAATIALVRDGDEGIETFLLRRQSTMAFAAGSFVFPGGTVHELDRCVESWVGPPPEEWAARLDCDVRTARALVAAAVRETFEESGILLAGPDAESVLGDTSEPEMQSARQALDAADIGLEEFLTSRGLVLRADLLAAWAHWITPSFVPRRYDTRFFVAVLPDGQMVELPREADHAEWVPVTRALEAVESGTAVMQPPTAITCREIAPFSADDILAAAAARDIISIQPQLVELDGEFFLENPLDEL